ncbi:MAG: HD domain-containing protein [Nitrososphaeria archaeon]
MEVKIEDKINEIRALIEKINDPLLKEKTLSVIEKCLFKSPYVFSPGAKKAHHSYLGGLIDHILSTTNIAVSIAHQLERIYGYNVDFDTVISASLLHDIMKPITYNLGESDKNSSLGHYLDHLTLSVLKLFQEGFPLKVIHAVAAHHGEPSPTRPTTIEAMIVHLADYIDSKLNGDILRKARSICQEELKESLEFNNFTQVVNIFEKQKKILDQAQNEFTVSFLS